MRTHLGVETQRQWSDLAIDRTTPVLLGLFSWTTLAAHALQKQRPMTQRRAAWYDKPSPTFVDAIALVPSQTGNVRRVYWRQLMLLLEEKLCWVRCGVHGFGKV